ncbi:unnamed protein product [Caenorhabditis auriculariae]|uniref:CWH43-like N-terminal domain-containing protein n=1 Tax=Caenorhabditis auriculariae TaxID=2777116 RepID=A0A8S1HWY5_9PELO|nr:unnamed protein product [Caenorhabditis auriculariae]
MASLTFEPAKRQLVLSEVPLQALFAAWLAAPPIAVGCAFVVGYTLHYRLLYDYFWDCRNVFLPSVSRVLNLPLERTLWNLLILFHIPLHTFVIIRQATVLGTNTHSRKNLLRSGASVSAAVSSVFLSSLATVGEREDGILHMVFFCGYTTTTAINSVLFTWLLHNSHIVEEKNTCARIRLVALLGFSISVPAISLFFVLHNVFCLPAAYELFAIFEYATVLWIFALHACSWNLMGDVVVAVVLTRPEPSFRL